MTRVPVLIVGGGPAGLATSYALKKRGVGHAVMERGGGVGHSWEGLYDSLVLHTGKHLSHLPGMPFPKGTPLFPSREEFLNYLKRYAETFKLPVWHGVDVARAARSRRGWELQAADGRVFEADHLVVATGIIANPYVPSFPGEIGFGGMTLHSSDYHSPEPFHDRRVVVVGAGNSAAEIAAELADAGVEVAISVRDGAYVFPRCLFDIPVQYYSVWLQKLPRWLQDACVAAARRITRAERGSPVLPEPLVPVLARPPIIGFDLVDAIEDGTVALKPGIDHLTSDGVAFTDGTFFATDILLLATGYRPVVSFIKEELTLDERGFPARDGTASTDRINLHFVGHTYGTVGALHNIAREAVSAAREIARQVDWAFSADEDEDEDEEGVAYGGQSS